MVDSTRTTEELKTKASQTVGAAQAEVEKRAEGAKSSLADEIAGIASALKNASNEFGSDSMQAKTFQQIADGLSGTSDSLRGKSFGEMLNNLNSFARNNPAAFLGGAAALGFVASRFAVASQKNDAQSTTPTQASTPAPASTVSPAAPASPAVSSTTGTTVSGSKP
ncbi:hypothetical protein [Nitratireductor basaltis]|uniref:Nutrient deprivation-induced protein n=1 Tax=Nitratireductor basaltis TaxID=472175 RepID=A0A084U504_9HYPH|nr:hypothetical protein [Nitratireductor basaltis]KFB08040.1 hypothetical protein EL18_03250 [Nitratireductor basaltis]